MIVWAQTGSSLRLLQFECAFPCVRASRIHTNKYADEYYYNGNKSRTHTIFLYNKNLFIKRMKINFMNSAAIYEILLSQEIDGCDCVRASIQFIVRCRAMHFGAATGDYRTLLF